MKPKTLLRLNSHLHPESLLTGLGRNAFYMDLCKVEKCLCSDKSALLPVHSLKKTASVMVWGCVSGFLKGPRRSNEQSTLPGEHLFQGISVNSSGTRKRHFSPDNSLASGWKRGLTCWCPDMSPPLEKIWTLWGAKYTNRDPWLERNECHLSSRGGKEWLRT